MTTKLGRSVEDELGSGWGVFPEQLNPKNNAKKLDRMEVESIGFFNINLLERHGPAVGRLAGASRNEDRRTIT
jgi:hypothetical protein